tara:strand:- start:537 stop:722 length:186 start_codon:yes stop_codon:yes gene_type:complete
MKNFRFWFEDSKKREFVVGDSELDIDASPYETIVNLEHALDLAEKYIVELERETNTYNQRD